MRSVIGVIRGSEEPEKLVILGNHLDAWIYGAVDPSSGTAAMLEMARAFGQAAKKGHRPRRTIVFAVWDGEEPLLGGSTQWALDNAEHLRSNAVTYINVDTGVQGGEFIGGATPALARFPARRDEIVQDPARASSSTRAGPHVRRPGARGRDDRRRHRLHGVPGIPRHLLHRHVFRRPVRRLSLHVRRLLPPEHRGRPGLQIGVGLSRLWGILAWRLANAEILPMRYSDYARAAVGYIEIGRTACWQRTTAPADGGARGAARGKKRRRQFEQRLAWPR